MFLTNKIKNRNKTVSINNKNCRYTRTRRPDAKKKGYKTPGRKGVYDNTYPGRVFELASLGLTNEKMAIAFGVNITTFEYWTRKHEEFSEAMHKGKEKFDTGVEKTLLQRAMGYSYEEVQHRTGVDSQGREYSYTTATTKQVLPDVTAMIFWLKNRKRTEWADVHKQEITSNVTLNTPPPSQIEHLLSPEEQKFIRSIALKQLKQVRGVSSN